MYYSLSWMPRSTPGRIAGGGGGAYSFAWGAGAAWGGGAREHGEELRRGRLAGAIDLHPRAVHRAAIEHFTELIRGRIAFADQAVGDERAASLRSRHAFPAIAGGGV